MRGVDGNCDNLVCMRFSRGAQEPYSREKIKRAVRNTFLNTLRATTLHQGPLCCCNSTMHLEDDVEQDSVKTTANIINSQQKYAKLCVPYCPLCLLPRAIYGLLCTVLVASG